ncbi:putative E3 ubiquitin-protein ligase HECTD2 [Nymphon striatum]|nr:putative E3 ubiquitin-protein ligase HECTD2 [Nymphon striatum]
MATKCYKLRLKQGYTTEIQKLKIFHCLQLKTDLPVIKVFHHQDQGHQDHQEADKKELLAVSGNRLTQSLDSAAFREEKKRSLSESAKRSGSHSSKGTLASRVGSGTSLVEYPKSEYEWHNVKPTLTETSAMKGNQKAPYENFKNFLSTIFSSFININATFKITPTEQDAKLDDPHLKLVFLHNVYDSLSTLPSHLTKNFVRAIITCLLDYKQSWKQLLPKDNVRGFFIILQFPGFDNAGFHSPFGHILRFIDELPPQDRALIMNWLRLLDNKRIKRLIRTIHQFVTMKEFPRDDHKAHLDRKHFLPAAIKMLSLIYKSTQTSHHKKIPYTEFYNASLDHIELFKEYQSWENSKKNRFNYCQYPFVLTIAAKKHILQKDAQHQMVINARHRRFPTVTDQVASLDVFFLNISIRRSHLVSDSLNEIVKKQADLKKKLRVSFVGEPGLDMGGLTKEWFLLLIRKIFHPDYGMFVYHEKCHCYWFSTTHTESTREYNLIGVLMGLAVYNLIILDLHFPTVCYRKLLSPEVIPMDAKYDKVGLYPATIEDLSEIMPEVSNGLKELLKYEGNVEEDFGITFEAAVEEFGMTKSHLLIPNGDKIPVTNASRQDYVSAYVNYFLNEGIKEKFKAFYLGFHSVCASNALIVTKIIKILFMFEEGENEEYVQTDFWDILSSFSIELQRQFLMFTTGSDRVPVGGISEMNFKISSMKDRNDVLPVSHTCFNQLVLPKYPNKDVMRKKLVIAISNAEGFGLE